MSFNEGAKIHNPLPAPPAISRSSVPPRILQIPTSKISPTRSSSIGPKPTKPISDKVGRWTEEEHMTFLAGLEKHGKQWKTIATMIGTRTVVQVRTHAQKYFQKQERKNKSSISSVEPRVLGGGTTACKRKSLPSTMPSHQQRSKKILRTDLYTDKAALHCKPRISISLTNIPKYTSSRDMPTPTGDMM
jgi:SHAQKYF class myb-like DNA-binding protein